jgi:hypothetical protein
MWVMTAHSWTSVSILYILIVVIEVLLPTSSFFAPSFLYNFYFFINYLVLGPTCQSICLPSPNTFSAADFSLQLSLHADPGVVA